MRNCKPPPEELFFILLLLIGPPQEASVHLDDVVDAISKTIDRRGQLPPESVLLLGEAETLGYEELQRERQMGIV